MSDTFEKKLLEKAQSGELDRYIDQLDKYADHPDNIRKLKTIMDEVDHSKVLTFFRNKMWDKIPYIGQAGLMHLTQGPLIGTSHGPLQTMVKFGLITYKGTLNEDGKIIQEKIEAMGGLDKYLLKYGVSLGKYFIPELAAIEPLIGPLTKLQSIGDKNISRVRHHLIQRRQAEQDALKNINDISDNTRDKVSEIMPNLPGEHLAEVIPFTASKPKNNSFKKAA